MSTLKLKKRRRNRRKLPSAADFFLPFLTDLDNFESFETNLFYHKRNNKGFLKNKFVSNCLIQQEIAKNIFVFINKEKQHLHQISLGKMELRNQIYEFFIKQLRQTNNS